MTSILSTIGPATESEPNLKKILKHSKFLRLNGAHNNLEWHRKISNLIKKISPSCKILIDLPGIKPRTLNKNNIKIKKNTKVLFFFGNEKTIKKKILKIPLTKPLPKYKKPKFFSVSDGKYTFKYISRGKNFILGNSLDSFTLYPKKGLNIPFSVYDDKLQQKIYLAFLDKIKKFKIDAIGLSYVQNSDIIKKIKKKTNKIIVSKVENIQGCKNIDKICYNSDIIMIDRGDLSAEIGANNLYSQTINISKKTKQFGKLLVIATENLETMISNNVPTKSEIISLSFSKSLYADYLMLSDETATSKKFSSTLKWLKNFNKMSKFNKQKIKKKKIEEKTIDLLFEHLNKIDDENSKILIFTRRGYVIERILKINPKIEMVVFTDNQKVYDLSYLRANCKIFKTNKFPKNLDKFIYVNIRKNKSKIFSGKNYFYLVYAAFARKHSRANTFTIVKKEDFK